MLPSLLYVYALKRKTKNPLKSPVWYIIIDDNRTIQCVRMDVIDLLGGSGDGWLKSGKREVQMSGSSEHESEGQMSGEIFGEIFE